MCFELRQRKPYCTSKAIPLVIGCTEYGTKNFKEEVKILFENK